MAFNIFSLYQAYAGFRKNHPELFPFMAKAVGNELKEGSKMELTITGPDGKKVETSIEVKSSDMKLFNYLKLL